jgi:hypothetical protein
MQRSLSTSVLLAVCLLAVRKPPAWSADLTEIDRTIRKEPAYQSKSPKYCLLVFGHEAETRVWLALDLDSKPWESSGENNALRQRAGTKTLHLEHSFASRSVNALGSHFGTVLLSFPRV